MTSLIKARATVYKGIRMRSRLEAGFATWLDRLHFEWEYEPCAFASEEGQYLPDFRLSDVFVSWRAKPTTVYVEVKPKSFEMIHYGLFMANPITGSSAEQNAADLACSSRIIQSSEPDAILALAQEDEPLALIEDSPVEPRIADEYIASRPYLVALPGGHAGFARGCTGPWHQEFWKRKRGPSA